MSAAAIVLALATVAAPPGATSCSGCHGAAGLPAPLEGRPAAQIVAAMTSFRSGALPATVMDRIAKGFSQDETAAIADWLSRQPPRPAR